MTKPKDAAKAALAAFVLAKASGTSTKEAKATALQALLMAFMPPAPATRSRGVAKPDPAAENAALRQALDAALDALAAKG